MFALLYYIYCNNYSQLMMQDKKANQLTSDTRVVLCDIEKNIDYKILTQFLTATKAIGGVSKLIKVQEGFLLEFVDEESAKNFIKERAFVDKIFKRKFNLYLASFMKVDDQNFHKFQVNGVQQDKLRPLFQICNEFGFGRLILKYQSGKLSYKAKVVFKDTIRSPLNQLKDKLAKIAITIKEIKLEEGSFKCSIELVNYAPISGLQLDSNEKQVLQQQLYKYIGNIVEEQTIEDIEITTFLHMGIQPTVKAYFKCESIQSTMIVFEKLRRYLIDEPQLIHCRLYYFQNEADTFMTLFTKGLKKPEGASLKQFQDQLLTAFRKISQNTVQVHLKKSFGDTYTGKIYLSDEQSGKQFIVDYPKKRNVIYQLYMNPSKIDINIFQNINSIKQVKKCQDNVQRLMSHIQATKTRDQKQNMHYPNQLRQQPYQPQPYNHHRNRQANWDPKRKDLIPREQLLHSDVKSNQQDYRKDHKQAEIPRQFKQPKRIQYRVKEESRQTEQQFNLKQQQFPGLT